MSELEAAVELCLLNRTTRSFCLTEAGQAYLSAAEAILSAAEVAHEGLRERTAEPQGLLRISMPESLIGLSAHSWLLEFTEKYPRIQIDLNTSPAYVDPAGDNFDIAVRDDPLADSSLTTRHLATFKRALFASPEYVEKCGAPSHPAELTNHECICSGPALHRSVWKLSNGTDQMSVTVKGQVKVDSLILAPLFAIDGLGIASAAKGSLRAELASGKLVPILPDWQHEPLTFSALMTSKLLPAKTRAFLDHFAMRMRELQSAIG